MKYSKPKTNQLLVKKTELTQCVTNENWSKQTTKKSSLKLPKGISAGKILISRNT